MPSPLATKDWLGLAFFARPQLSVFAYYRCMAHCCPTAMASLTRATMATMRKRLERLEAKRGIVGAGPCVILICDALTGEPGGALLMGGGRLTREAGESAEAFTARATVGASHAIHMPENGR